jgi:hypothetical protein
MIEEMSEVNALRDKNVVNRMRATESISKNTVSHIRLKLIYRNRAKSTLIHRNGKGARPPCGQR